MKRLLLLLLLIWQTALLFAQDFHWSNYQSAGVHFNPAMTGVSGSDVRLGVQYRRQWSSLPQPFTTIGATSEWRGNKIGFGFHAYQNEAGKTSLNTSGFMLSGAYHQPLANMSELSLGIAFGRLQKSFDPNHFTFDNQYVEGQGFATNLTSGEDFAQTSISTTDVSVGLNWTGLLSPNGKIRGRGGFAFSHIHRPDMGFYGFVEELPMKTVAHAGLDIRIGDQFDFSPNVFFQNQGVHRELIVGTSVDGKLDEHSSIILGMAYRIEDAFIGQVGFRHKNKHFHFSYDANSSRLRTVTGGHGAWELGLYLTFNHKNKKERKDTDGDGIYDHRDECPKVPGVAALRGCPEAQEKKEELADADKDGVPDELDRCPLEPGLPCFYGCNDRDRDGTNDHEDSCPEIFGPPENNGCPILGRDSDKDGIPDDEDYCIYLKGHRDFHGCPDSDNDRISDVDDHCPYRKGPLENHGCPVDMTPFDNGISSVVEYRSNQHKLTPLHQSILADFVNEVPIGVDYKIIVSGHTDAEGTAFYNHELGNRRANTVMEFLVKRGIPYERIETISYGEAIPRRSNSSTEGRARNRRSEIQLIEN